MGSEKLSARHNLAYILSELQTDHMDMIYDNLAL